MGPLPPPSSAPAPWRPNPGPQARFLASRARRALYGGAAGGGKSAALLAGETRWFANPHYRGLYLRREASYLGETIDKSRALYPRLGGRLVTSPHPMWTFPSGATLWLNHCQTDADIANYDTFEFSSVVFDELTHFTEKQFLGICARLRGTDPTLPYWARAATNPGGPGHEWVKARWGPWLDAKHPHRAAPGEVRWRLGLDWVPAGTPDALSYTFVPAKLTDNPHVGREYVANLRDLDSVRRAQLEDGDWEAAYGEGSLFHKDWWGSWLDAAPPCERKARGWDLGSGGDCTEGVLLGDRGAGVVPQYVVLDVETHRGPPHEVHELVRKTAERDGPDVVIAMPQDPGQAGKDQAQTYTRELTGYTVASKPVTGDKIVRAGAFSSQVGAHNAAVVRAPWTPRFVSVCHNFPEGADDVIDAMTEAFRVLNTDQSHGHWLRALYGDSTDE